MAKSAMYFTGDELQRCEPVHYEQRTVLIRITEEGRELRHACFREGIPRSGLQHPSHYTSVDTLIQ